jgi:hypothetical protein
VWEGLRERHEVSFPIGDGMQQIDCIRFVDEATGCGVRVSVFQRDDAMVLLDFQLAGRPASVLSLPSDLARRLAEALIRAIPSTL